MEEKRIPSGGVSRNLTRCGSCAVRGRITDGFPRLQRLSPLPATMANASAKKTAASNERAIQNLRQGLLVASTLSMFIRIIFRTKSLSPAQVSFWLHILSHIPSTFIARYLYKIGEPRRTDTGELISPGEDLNQPGVIEWCFDIIYVTCKHVPNSPGIMFQAVHCRGVPNRERNIWGKVLGVSRGRKPFSSPSHSTPSNSLPTHRRSRYMRFTKSGHHSSGHTLALGNPPIRLLMRKKMHLSKLASGRRNSRSVANGETLVSKQRPSRSNSRQ